MNKILIIAEIMLVVLLVVFFYLKDAEYVVGTIMPANMENATVEVKYDCFGFFCRRTS